MYLDIYIDEFGDIQSLKSDQIFGLGYFAIKSSSSKSFIKELQQSGLSAIHLRTLKPNEKLKVIIKFAEIAKRYPCFGGAYIQTSPNSPSEIIKEELIQRYGEKGFNIINDKRNPSHKVLLEVLGNSRFYDTYSAAMRIPFIHEGQSVLKGKSKFARIHIGITGNIFHFQKKMLKIAPDILSEAEKSHAFFRNRDFIAKYKSVEVKFDLTYENPFLGAADIFANVGRFKVVDEKRFNDSVEILSPVLKKINTDTFMVV